MPLQSHSKRPGTGAFTLHDDSHRTRVVLGSGFSLHRPAQNIDDIKTLLHHVPAQQAEWEYAHSLMTMDILSQSQEKSRWIIGCEENIHDRSAFRVMTTNSAHHTDCHLQLHEDFVVESEPHDLMECVPDSVFGAMLGAATGMVEVKKLVLDAVKSQYLTPQETPRSDWRAPRFSFTLQTAAGSPFVERWAFALQESAIRTRRFRVWIEQQRTGREMQLLLREDGTIEGIHDVETLPAAIHGAALGMLMGINHVLHSLQRVVKEVSQASQPFAAGLSDQEAEALLEHYVAQIRERRNIVPNN